MWLMYRFVVSAVRAIRAFDGKPESTFHTGE
jgi:hypothetical protein